MKQITYAVRIHMFHAKEDKEILNLEEKTELIKTNRYDIRHICSSKEIVNLQNMIVNGEATLSQFETNTTLQTSVYDALVVCKNRKYYLIKWKK